VTSYTEAGQTIGYRYYPSGKLAKLIYPGGTENDVGHVEYTYNADGRLYQVIDKMDSTSSPRTTTYAWNTDGRLASISRPNGTTRTISYDSAGRPNGIAESAGLNWTIGYWSSDDIKTLDLTPAIPANQLSAVPNATMTFDSANQLSTFNGQTVTHDLDGNMLTGPTPTGGTAVYSYDSRNRLTGMGVTAYTYNAENNRVGITSPTETTTLVVDPEGALPKVLVRTKNGVTTRYVYGAGLQYEVSSAGVATYYHYDQSGNTAALSNQAGSIIERVTYSPYGTIRYRQSNFDTPFLFNGMFGVMTDSNGLINMRARYYNPATMRFVNSDPARDGLNWYSFANANPLSFTDPTGTSFTSSFGEGLVTGIVTGVVIVGVAAGAVTIGVPAAVVTGTLFVAGAIGGGATIYSIASNPTEDNIGYNLGAVTGGAIVGGIAAKPLGKMISPPGYQQSVSSPTIKAEFDMMWRNGPQGSPSIPALFRDFPTAMSTGPTFGAVSGSVSSASAGASNGYSSAPTMQTSASPTISSTLKPSRK
jgi:RHS repeat-associated protein